MPACQPGITGHSIETDILILFFRIHWQLMTFFMTGIEPVC